MKIGFVSLGCARNVVDLEVMLGSLREHQHEFTLSPEKSDVLLINTCGFIRDAVEESLGVILEAIAWKREGKIQKIVVSGCLPQRYREELTRELSGVDVFLGSGEQNRIVEVIDTLSRGMEASPTEWPTPRFLYSETSPRFPLTPPHTAFVKVSEGCLNDCSFCIIPKIRGVYRERSLESICEEVTRLAETRPLKEVNLIGQDTSLYGKRLYREHKLPELLRRLSASGVPWVRVLYLHPAHFTDDLIEVFRTGKNICPYIDMPIQHASDILLSSMRRECTQEGMRAIFLKLREALPGFVLRTSVMVGYPGETDRDFETLLGFIREIQFDRLGTFIFSREEKTDAYPLPNQVPLKVKKMRYDAVMTLQREISRERLTRYLGKSVDVLIEEEDPKDPALWVGRSRGDAPEVDGQVFVHGKNLKIGEIVPVAIRDSYDYDLVGDSV